MSFNAGVACCDVRRDRTPRGDVLNTRRKSRRATSVRIFDTRVGAASKHEFYRRQVARDNGEV
jgi:hypothetical protein